MMMEKKRQLDFNAPLISVRRFSSPSHPSNLMKRKPIKDELLSTLDEDEEELSEPCSVPFHWEQAPGRPKTGLDTPTLTPSTTPRLPPGRVSGPFTFNSGDQNNIQRAQAEVFSLTDHDKLLEKLNESLNCSNSEVDDTESWDQDSDAPGRISQTDSSTLNYRVSELNGYESPGFGHYGTFTVDRQTRDFMMDRFLPAAKAAIVETPRYGMKMPRVVFEEKAKHVKKFVSEEKNPLLESYGSLALPYYNEYINNIDSEDDELEFHVPVKKVGKLSCWIVPRFCARKSLRHSGPIDKNASRRMKKSSSGMLSQLRRYRSGGSISPYRPDTLSKLSTRKGEVVVADRAGEIKLSQDRNESWSLGYIESGILDLESVDDDGREYDHALLKSPMPPPLPKSPSESWLWRTLPSIPLGNTFSRRSHFHS